MITQLKNTHAKSSLKLLQGYFSLFTTSKCRVVTAVTTASEYVCAEWGKTDSSQCALNVAAKKRCHLDFMEKEFNWLIAGHFNPFLGHGILSAYLGLSSKNQDWWSPYNVCIKDVQKYDIIL
jgi:hypothetical protein